MTPKHQSHRSRFLPVLCNKSAPSILENGPVSRRSGQKSDSKTRKWVADPPRLRQKLYTQPERAINLILLTDLVSVVDPIPSPHPQRLQNAESIARVPRPCRKKGKDFQFLPWPQNIQPKRGTRICPK